MTRAERDRERRATGLTTANERTSERAKQSLKSTDSQQHGAARLLDGNGGGGAGACRRCVAVAAALPTRHGWPAADLLQLVSVQAVQELCQAERLAAVEVRGAKHCGQLRIQGLLQQGGGEMENSMHGSLEGAQGCRAAKSTRLSCGRRWQYPLSNGICEQHRSLHCLLLSSPASCLPPLPTSAPCPHAGR